MTIDQSLKRDLGQRHQQSTEKTANEDNFHLDLDQQIVSSSKQVLLHKIDFVPAKKSFSFNLDTLRSKYIPLNPSKKDGLKQQKFDHKKQKENGMGKGSGNESIAGDGIPKPKVVLFPSEKLKVEWHKMYRVGSGLMNLGNTCFLNSTLQCLTYTPPLVNYLMSQQHTQSCREPGFCMICELQRHVARAFHQSGSVIRPMVIIQKIKNIGKQFRYGHQEDAHEFLRCITEAMQKASLTGLEKLDRYSKETTLVHQIFGGYFRSRVQCLKCQEKSDTHDPFLDISVDIKHVSTITKALDRLVKPEMLDNDNMYMCKGCKMKVPAIKRLNVHRAPNILTLSLKRFDFNRYSGTKITKDVRYPEMLDLRPYMSQKSGPAIVYRLYAVLVHHGYSCNSGHYYCYVRAPNDAWYCMNDSTVTQTNLRTILDQEAYILFYIRRPSGKLQQNSSEKAFNQSSIFSPKFVNKPASATVSSASNPVNGPVGKVIERPKPHTLLSPKPTPSPKLVITGTPVAMKTRPPPNLPTTIPEPGKREKVQFNLSVKPKQGLSPASSAQVQVKKEMSVERMMETPTKPSISGSGDAALVPYTGDSDESSEDYDETVARLSNLPLKDEQAVNGKADTDMESETSKRDASKDNNEKATGSFKVDAKKQQMPASDTPLPEKVNKVPEKPVADSDAADRKGIPDQSPRKQTPQKANGEKNENMKPPEKTTPVSAKSVASIAGSVSPLNRTPVTSQNSPLKLTLSKVSSFKVNATSSAWKINDHESQISPSLASDSSNHSMNSTGGEWTVIDKKDAPSTPKVAEFAHPGWTVRTKEEYKKHEEEVKAKAEKERESKQESGGGSDEAEKPPKGSPHKKCSMLERQYSCPGSGPVCHTAMGHKRLFKQLSAGGVKRHRTHSDSLSDTPVVSGGRQPDEESPPHHKHAKKRKHGAAEEDDRSSKRPRSDGSGDDEQEESRVVSDKTALLNGDSKESRKHKKHKKHKKKKKKARDRHEDEATRHQKHSDDSEEEEDHRKERKKKKKRKRRKHKEDTVALVKEEESGSEEDVKPPSKPNGDHPPSKKDKTHKAPSQHWDHHVKDGYKKLHGDEETSRSKTWDGSKSSSAVDELLGRSNSKGYGAKIESWGGGKSIVDQEAEMDREARKRKDDDYDEEYDWGKVKKVKRHRPEEYHQFKSGNRFQYEQNRKNSGFRSHMTDRTDFRYHKFSRSQSWSAPHWRQSHKH